MRNQLFVIAILFVISGAYGVAVLELQRFEVTNEYVYNRPVITAIYENVGDNATSIINHSMDISKPYILSSPLPDFIEAGENWVLTYTVDELSCSDYTSTIDYTINVSYTSSTGDVVLSNSSSFVVGRPLQIVNTNPDPSGGFTIIMGETRKFLFDVFNNGTSDRVFNFSTAKKPIGLYLLIQDHIKKYQLSDFENTTFTLGGKDRRSYEVDIVPTAVANNLVEFTINYNESCPSMSNELDFFVSSKTKSSGPVDVVFADGLNIFHIFAVLLISATYLWRS